MLELGSAGGKGKIVSVVLVVLFSMLLSLSDLALCLTDTGQQAKEPSSKKILQNSSDLLQFKAGGHIVGFKPGNVYMASPDHALGIEFIGSRQVEPKTVSATGIEDNNAPRLLGRVEYRHQWDGITVRYDASEEGIAESTYIVEPGCDVQAIRLRYNVPVEAGPDGSLRFKLSSKRGWMTETPPVAWQEIGGDRVPIEVAFKVQDGLVGFDVGKYDHQHSLVIDPTYKWHTFYGSSHNADIGRAIAVDGSGNIYVTGKSESSGTWPAWDGPGGQDPLHAPGGSSDIFVMKLNANGVYQWHTFYGSSDIDEGRAIAVDAGGNVYVAGWSDVDTGEWPDVPPPLHAHGSGADIVVLKLDSNGIYQWHTFYSGNYGYAIAVDGNSNVYVVGTSPSTWLGDGNTSPLHPHSGDDDIAILKLDTDGAYQWHTFYGSAVTNAHVDEGFGIAVDGSGNVYVAGYSYSTWQGDGGANPLHPHSPEEQGKVGHNSDIVVLKLDGEGNYQWHTFYGAVDGYWATGDFGHAIAVDGSGNVYVKGESRETWQGDGGRNPLHPYTDGSYNVTIIKLNTDGAYQWHTFYSGETHPDNMGPGIGLAVSGGGVYLTGFSYGTWLGDGDADPVHTVEGGRNMWALKLDGNSGDYRWHTFYGAGAGSNTTGYDIAVDANRNVYVTGYSTETWTGDKGKNPLHAFLDSEDGRDIAILKLSDPIIPVKVLSPDGGDILGSGSVFPVKWTAPVHAVKFRLYYSMDNGVTWTKLHASSYLAGRSYNWTVPTPAANKPQCLLKAIGYTWNGKKAGEDTSDAPFTMAVVKLTAPNGGQNLASGGATNITWRKNKTSGAVKTAVLYYSTNAGATWKSIKVLTGTYDPPGNYSYRWTIPTVGATLARCRVKIVLKNAAGTIVGNDMSDTNFTISPP